MPAEDSPKPPVPDHWLRHVLADVAAQEENSGFSRIDAFFTAAKKYGSQLPPPLVPLSSVLWHIHDLPSESRSAL